MKLQYWGTAAAGGVPAIFCRCEICKEARKRGGKNLRGRPNALIDGVLKIDFNADTYAQSLRYGVDLTEIHHLLVTHTHPDHFYPNDLHMRRQGFAHYRGGDSSFAVYGSDKVREQIRYMLDDSGFEGRLSFTEMKPFRTVAVGDYNVTAYPAVHAQWAGPLIYRIEKDGKNLLYCHDSGPLKEEVFAHWRANGVVFDFVSLDCTEGCSHISYDAHMSFERDVAMKERMLKEGFATEKTVFCCNHFSHNGANSLYDEFVEIAAKEGFIVSFDGMEVEI